MELRCTNKGGGIKMRNEIKTILNKLDSLENKMMSYLSNARDRGNEKAEEKLEAELELIQDAIDSLENIE